MSYICVRARFSEDVGLCSDDIGARARVESFTTVRFLALFLFNAHPRADVQSAPTMAREKCCERRIRGGGAEASFVLELLGEGFFAVFGRLGWLGCFISLIRGGANVNGGSL